MECKNKYTLVVKPNGDDIDSCADAVVRAVAEADNVIAVANEIRAYGEYTLQDMYIDIARSKKFKVYQQLQNKNLFNASVSIREGE